MTPTEWPAAGDDERQGDDLAGVRDLYRELAQRLLGVLQPALRLAPPLRPLPRAYDVVLTCPSEPFSLRVQIIATGTGLVIQLRDPSGYVVRTVAWEYSDADPDPVTGLP